jgi:hypothetical protein
MSRKLFIVASNGPEAYRLKYAETDAEKFAACLSDIRYGFEIIWPKKKTKYQIWEELENVIKSCAEDDTLICYFAGHGHIPKGKLHIVVDDNDDLDRASWRLSNILVELEENCKAKNKLVILDCCHAGAAETRGIADKYEDIIPESNYAVLAASDRLSTIREYPDLGGSFLTQKICEGLNSEFHNLDRDKDDRITLEDLKNWLQNSNAKYNSTKNPKEKAPLPYLKNGYLKGSFYLTQESFPWKPQMVTSADGNEFVVLPIEPKKDVALCISKYPVTNAQYKQFIEATNGKEPEGRYLPKEADNRIENWSEGFIPWQHEGFNSPHQPVVCVSYYNSVAYLKWLNTLHKPSTGVTQFLPPICLWNFAAFGFETQVDNYIDRSKWKIADIHQNTSSPIEVNRFGGQANSLGISDLFGNVWEFCYGEVTPSYFCGPSFYYSKPKLRGGGFLDNFSADSFTAYLDTSILTQDAFNFKSFDLGFRTACAVPIASLTKEISMRLSYCSPVSDKFWSLVHQQIS